MDLRDRRHLNRGLGDALATAFEFAATTAIFLFIGWALDRWLGTQPLFMIVLSLFALVGQAVKLAYRYAADMRREQEARDALPRGTAG